MKKAIHIHWHTISKYKMIDQFCTASQSVQMEFHSNGMTHKFQKNYITARIGILPLNILFNISDNIYRSK